MLLAVSLILGLSLSTNAQAPTVEVLPNGVAQQLLRGLIPPGKKMVTVSTFVAATSVEDRNLGMSCESSSSGKTTGTVDDDGNIDAKSTGSGSTNCSERHIYHDTMELGFQGLSDPNASYLLTAVCTEKWVWNHCGMPPKGSTYALVIEADKNGQFTIYVATSDRIGGKSKVAKFAIVQLSHVKGAQAASTPH